MAPPQEVQAAVLGTGHPLALLVLVPALMSPTLLTLWMVLWMVVLTAVLVTAQTSRLALHRPWLHRPCLCAVTAFHAAAAPVRMSAVPGDLRYWG